MLALQPIEVRLIPHAVASAVATGRNDAVDALLVADILRGLEQVQPEGPMTGRELETRVRVLTLIQRVRADRWRREALLPSFVAKVDEGLLAIDEAMATVGKE